MFIFYEFAEGRGQGIDLPLLAFIGEEMPLNTKYNPISKSEVAYTVRKLNSNRATGPDQIQNELLNYADPIVYDTYYHYTLEL